MSTPSAAADPFKGIVTGKIAYILSKHRDSPELALEELAQMVIDAANLSTAALAQEMLEAMGAKTLDEARHAVDELKSSGQWTKAWPTTEGWYWCYRPSVGLQAAHVRVMGPPNQRFSAQMPGGEFMWREDPGSDAVWWMPARHVPDRPAEAPTQ